MWRRYCLGLINSPYNKKLLLENILNCWKPLRALIPQRN
nr:MAG TPA: hypothetical protein [Caudoviricetes sp.]DAU18191.1 MAG TPA: hypothetical protein [Caudoviricetes sp.]